MSGVIDEHGQWEHCQKCRRFVLIQDLLYEEASTQFPYGRNLCESCASTSAHPVEVFTVQLPPEVV